VAKRAFGRVTDNDYSEVHRPLHRELAPVSFAALIGSDLLTADGKPPIQRPRAFGIARMQATDLYPPFAIFVYWIRWSERRPVTELFGIAAREI
jgi:hypothetical protein